MDQAIATISPFSDPAAATEAVAEHASLTCRLAENSSEIELHRKIRQVVFVDEQRLFVDSDLDRFDEDPETLYALGHCGPVVGGVVRLYPLEGGLWKGDRLAVLPAFRKLMLGAALVNFAVRTAGERGGHTMVAFVQVQNVRFFESLGWHKDGEPFAYHGQPHQQMLIGLQRTEGRQ